MKNQLHDSDIPPALVAVDSPSALTCAVNIEVDARQLACPLPLLKAKQGLRNLLQGELLRVFATDAGSLKDFVSFAQLTGQVIESFYAQAGCYCFVIRKQ